MAAIEIDNLLDILQQKENDITINDDTKEIIKILSAIKISKQQILRSYAQLSELPNPSLINKGNIYYVEAENGLYVSTGAAWLKIESTSLASFNVISGAPSGNGGLTYDNTTGEFIFNPADLSNKLELLDLSVCTNTASGNGNLSYNNHTGEFAFTPADLSSIDVTNAICDFICLTDLSICTNTASGNGNLSYNNTTGEFAFTPADIDNYFTNGNICNLYMTGTLCGLSTFTIDPAAHGDNTGTVVIAGNLQVDGVTTTVNSCTLEVADKNIVLACGSANAITSDGAGITADLGSDGSATLTYSSSNDRWEMNKSLATSVIGNVTGQVSDISNHSTTNLSEGTNLYYTDARVDARISASPGDNQKVFVATGTIATGDVVALRSDGTVEPVSDSISADSFGLVVLQDSYVINTKYTYDTTNNRYVANGFYVAGSPQNYIFVGQIDSANNITINGSSTVISNCAFGVSTYDSYNNRIVFAYVDTSTGDGKYLVGEVNPSNNTITFGSAGTFDTAINFTSSATALDITYDSNNRKIVIAYVDGGSNNNANTIIVGEVNPSTNTLTLGTPTVLVSSVSSLQARFDGADTNPSLSMVFDPIRNHIAICFVLDFNSTGSTNTLTEHYIIIDVFTTNSNNTITLSGTTAGNGKSITTEAYGVQLLYDPSTTNYLVTYIDYTNNEYPTAVVCTYDSSNGVLFHTPVVLSTEPFNITYTDANIMNFSTIRGVYSQAANKFIISFDFTTSTKTELTYGTITNNNTFTFDTLYDSTIDDGSFQGWIEDPVSLKLAFSYWDGARTRQHVYTPTQISTNASSWFGVAAENIADTATGLIDLPGAVNRSQTGLTTNSIYYVDSDGSVTTTPTIYGKIGRAYSATELQIFESYKQLNFASHLIFGN